ncbi:SDR family NAD(P)-dependent oxidoreductase [Telluria beijingensis]|uniref:SDR family NAD(P)-dependent oxidoreductase n=1 Tax=Telluria beijingensis TaxID=3068633 RepID=UPI002795AA00|nr:SDR family NAD(P)-dependent oxidoreductase [Massilia sp. REN29]
MEDLFGLHGQVALVTGAAQGLGLAIATALGERGAAVLLADLDHDNAQRAAHSLRECGIDAQAFACDVGDPQAVQRLAVDAQGWRGQVDILVCNAGIQGPAGPLHAASNDDWQRVFDVNLRGSAALACALLPAMAERGAGRVILMSSIAGLRGNGAIGLYGLSKAALAQLARNLAVEWGPHGVCVNAISPGLIRTPLGAHLFADEAFMRRRTAMTPLRRVGEPHEVAGVAVMLAGRAGGFITGQNIVVDGGTLISDGS